jgi:hypothetical protein
MLWTPAAQAEGTVTNCTEASLRAAMASGGRVTFACDGTITLAGTVTNSADTILDGTGRQVTISGGKAVGLFYVGTNNALTILHMTLANGRGEQGGAIFNDSGILNLQDVFLGTNVCTWSSGGAIYNRSGTLNATNCAFSGNVAQAMEDPFPGPARGGGICNESGQVQLQECVFSDNVAHGVAGFQMPYGGGVFIGSPGGDGRGGAIYNSGVLEAAACALMGNSASGGAAGDMASSDPYAGGWGGASGGSGLGGGVFNLGTAGFDQTTFASNTVSGGPGGRGGPAWIGMNGPMPAGPDGPSGSADGGALANQGTATLVNATIAGNSDGIWDRVAGGGVALTNCTVALNGAGIQTTGAMLINTLLAANYPNCAGAIVDLGHNLSSDASCAFTNTTSLSGTDPKLGPLADNGGGTLTMALLAGSPAIDAGDSLAAPPTDERGFGRFGSAADIGAFEYWPPPPVLQVSWPPGGGVDILVVGAPWQSCRLLASSNLTTWTVTATNQTGGGGTVLFHDAGGGNRRFYRVVLP